MNFADSLLSGEQMKKVKGGYFNPYNPNDPDGNGCQFDGEIPCSCEGRLPFCAFPSRCVEACS